MNIEFEVSHNIFSIDHVGVGVPELYISLKKVTQHLETVMTCTLTSMIAKIQQKERRKCSGISVEVLASNYGNHRLHSR